MTKRRIGIVGIILLMIAISVWVLLPKHRGRAAAADGGLGAPIPVHASQIPGSLAAAKPVERLAVWTRPPAKVAARNLRRAKFALLRRFGASEMIVDRLTDGDIQSVIHELEQQAQQGDASAANVLQHLVRSNCAFAAINGENSPAQAEELLDAQSLAAEDAEWLKTAIQESNLANQQLVAACQAIDKKQVESWVANAADHGDGASLYMQWRFRGNQSLALGQEKLQRAVDAGYPEAQAWIAQSLTNGAPGFPSGGGNAENLFKETAETLPYAESQLAVCEFRGCPGIAADIPAAVAHAREAAERGSLDAMIEIGPKLMASQIDPYEVQAWNLVGALLAQQGCQNGGGLTVQWVSAATNTLKLNRVSDQARSLAEQYWRDYGAQMMSNIGCSP
jgi:TPR repeat protein